MIAEMSNIFLQLVYLLKLFSLVLQKIFSCLSPTTNLVCISPVNKLSENATCPLVHGYQGSTSTSGHYWFIPNIKLQSTGNNETSRQNQFLFNTKRLLHSASRLAPGDLLSAFCPFINLGLQKILIISIRQI